MHGGAFFVKIKTIRKDDSYEKEVYVVNCCRTAVGSFGGSLKDVPATDLGAAVVKVLARGGGQRAGR